MIYGVIDQRIFFETFQYPLLIIWTLTWTGDSFIDSAYMRSIRKRFIEVVKEEASKHFEGEE